MFDKKYALAYRPRWVLGVVIQHQLNLKHLQRSPPYPEALRL